MITPVKKSTAYGVFIIESLHLGDEPDAKVMNKILNMSNIVTLYNYAHSVAEFERLLEEFKKSNFRYLHLSCHADSKGLEIDGEDYTNQRLANFLKGGMNNKRLFMSACQGANRSLANKVIIGSGAMSLIGTPTDLYFDKAVLFWPSFYHVINKLDSEHMNRKILIKTLQKCTDLFGVQINYYSKIKKEPKALRCLKIRNGKMPDDQRIDF
jgi:hypothetical protein